jgi:hypothetical protein
MKRRFRQKQDQAPKNDPEKDKGISKDSSEENIDIDNVIEEIDQLLEPERDANVDDES